MASRSHYHLTRDEYTIAWLCALPIEKAATRNMLDDTLLPYSRYMTSPANRSNLSCPVVNRWLGTPNIIIFKGAWKILKLGYIAINELAIKNIVLFLLFSSVVMVKIHFKRLKGLGGWSVAVSPWQLSASPPRTAPPQPTLQPGHLLGHLYFDYHIINTWELFPSELPQSNHHNNASFETWRWRVQPDRAHR